MNLGSKFLAVLSSSKKLPFLGENGISSIIDAINVGGGQGDGDDRKYLDFIYAMEELGFLYLDRKKNKVVVEPQSLIRSIHSPEELFLSGARIPDYLAKVRDLCNRHALSYHENEYDTILPFLVRVKGKEGQLTALAEELQVKLDPVPRAYYEALLTVDFRNLGESWKFNDTSSGRDDGQNPEIRERFFNSSTLRYDGKCPSGNNHYNMGYRKRYGMRYYMFKYAENSLKVAEVEPRQAKWYCLSKRGFKLAYNNTSKVFYIPKYCPLPLGLARSLAMCSCMPPKQISLTANETERIGFKKKAMDFLEYRNIPEIIANLVKHKMNMELHAPF
jgi:hypothetical protein